MTNTTIVSMAGNTVSTRRMSRAVEQGTGTNMFPKNGCAELSDPVSAPFPQSSNSFLSTEKTSL